MRRRDEFVSEGDSRFQEGVEVGYLYATIKTQLNTITAKSGGLLSTSELAVGLGNLLLAEAVEPILHDPQRMPQVRRRAARGHEKPAPTEAIHVRPRHKRALTGSAGYWARLTPVERKAEVRRRRAVAERNRREAAA